jgi:hypothetical protein
MSKASKDLARNQMASCLDCTLSHYFIDMQDINHSVLATDGHINIGSMLSTIHVLVSIECINKPKMFWYSMPNSFARKN